MIVIQATFLEVEWEVGSEDPIERDGWTDPSYPGQLRHCEDNEVPRIQFASIWDAAMFITRWRYGVWDYREAESEQDMAGIWTSYMLHVAEGSTPFLFNLADFIESRERPRHPNAPRMAGNKSEMVQVLAKDVKVGMRLDLQNDHYADPDGTSATWRYEYAEVTDVEFETRKCIVLSGDEFRVGFPKDHLLARRMTDEEEKLWLNWRP